MNKSLLIQQVYPKRGFRSLLVETFDRNTKYCEEHDIDYMAIMSEILDAQKGGWDKLGHIKNALDIYELVIWLDADAIIYDLTRDLKTVPNPPDTIGAVKYFLPAPHLNVGVLYFRNGERVKRFVSDWLERYPGQGSWAEQMVFNSMKDKTVFSLPMEWNRIYDHNPSANPVVLGFHGFSDAKYRLELMKKVLNAD